MTFFLQAWDKHCSTPKHTCCCWGDTSHSYNTFDCSLKPSVEGWSKQSSNIRLLQESLKLLFWISQSALKTRKKTTDPLVLLLFTHQRIALASVACLDSWPFLPWLCRLQTCILWVPPALPAPRDMVLLQWDPECWNAGFKPCRFWFRQPLSMMIPYQNLWFKISWLTNPVYCILLKLIFEWDSQASHKNNIYYIIAVTFIYPICNILKESPMSWDLFSILLFW